MSETLFDIAKVNLNNARKLGKVLSDDPRDLNAVGYFMQQALEFSLKYLYEKNGMDYPKIHDIDRLYEGLIKFFNFEEFLGNDLFDELLMSSAAITSWESSSRYIKDWFLNYRTLYRIQFIVINIMKKIAEEDETYFDASLVLNKELDNESIDSDEEVENMEENSNVKFILKDVKGVNKMKLE